MPNNNRNVKIQDLFFFFWSSENSGSECWSIEMSQDIVL